MNNEDIFPKENLFHPPVGFVDNEVKRLHGLMLSRRLKRRRKLWITRTAAVLTAAAATICAFVLIPPKQEPIAPAVTQQSTLMAGNNPEQTYQYAEPNNYEVLDDDVFLWLY